MGIKLDNKNGKIYADGNLIVDNALVNNAASVAPTANEDSGDGYAVGSIWIDTTADKAYICVDATAAAAVWNQVDAAGGMSNVVEDTTPQLGGSLDVQANAINTSTTNGSITLTPDGTGDVVLGTMTFDADQTIGAGQDNYVLTYDNTGGKISLEAAAGGGLSPTYGNGSHRYWRIYITETADAGYMQFSEMQLRTSVGGADQCTGGTAISTGTVVDLANAFDNNTATALYSTVANLPCSVGYDFGSGTEHEIVELALTTVDNGSRDLRCPSHFVLQYSDDNVAWVSAKSFIKLDWSGEGATATIAFGAPAQSTGDLLAYTGTAWVNVAPGGDDQVLTADAAEAAGVKWAAPPTVTELNGLSDCVYNSTYGNLGLGEGALDSVDTLNGQYNVAIGKNAGTGITTGDYNTIIGGAAGGVGDAITTGGSNTLIGGDVMASATTSNNTGVGRSVFGNASGGNNTGVGYLALQNANGSDHTAIGYLAGRYVSTSTGCVCIGTNAGPTTGNHADNKLYIDNTQTVTPLIGGDFSTNEVTITGTLETTEGLVLGTNNQTGTTYTMVIGDGGQHVTMSNAAASTLTIPANSSVAYPIGTQILVTQLGAGQVTVGITTDTLNVNADFTKKLSGQYSQVVLTKLTSTTWVISGDLEVA